MNRPYYLDLGAAREELSELGIMLSEKQLKRAAEPDAFGKRKLPFFVDPIDGRLKIERNSLRGIYLMRQVAAEKNMRIS